MSFSASPLLNSLYRWYCVSSAASGGGVHRLTFSEPAGLYLLDLKKNAPLKSPYLTIFPSTEDATSPTEPPNYHEGVGSKFKDLVIELKTNGKNVEFYHKDTYLSTQRGTPSSASTSTSSATSSPGASYDFSLRVSSPSWPIMAKILSTPKRRDAGGHLVKDEAVVYSLTLSVSDEDERRSEASSPRVTQSFSSLDEAANQNPFAAALNSPSNRSSASSTTSSSSLPLPPQAAAAARIIENLSGRVSLLEAEVAALKSASARDDKQLIFFYGTLKRGFHNYNLYLHPTAATYSGASSFVASAYTKDPFTLTVGDHGVPYMLDGLEEGATNVKGELFRVDKEKVRLDLRGQPLSDIAFHLTQRNTTPPRLSTLTTLRAPTSLATGTIPRSSTWSMRRTGRYTRPRRTLALGRGG